MNKWKQNALYSLVGLLLGGVCMWVIGQMQGDDTQVNELLQRIKDYEAKEQEAIITKRVSQQMEEIAYQQKEVADQDREEAEAQYVLAEQMRQRAEEGEKAAREAQVGAVRSAKMADSLRYIAVGQMQLAEDRLNQVILTQQKNDTLRYRSLANTLADYSVNLRNGGNTELSNMLAYMAYTYAQRYQIQTANVLKAVLVHGPKHATLSAHKGSVKGLDMIGPEHKSRISVSSYGEILLWQQQKDNSFKPQTLFSDPRYDFRDVIAGENNSYYALDFNGWLRRGDVQAHTDTMIQLPATRYFDILRYDKSRIILLSPYQLSWYSEKEHKLIYNPLLPMPLTAACVKDGLVYLFYQNGDCQTLSVTGQFHTISLPVKGGVTCAVYSKAYNCFLLGMQDGTIQVLDSQRRLAHTLPGHSAAITAIQHENDYIITSSYDKTVRCWFIGQQEGTLVAQSVELNLGDWPRAIHANPLTRMLWVGLENGSILPLSFQFERNLRYIKQQLKRNFTHEEWNYYLGENIPYETIK